MDPKRRRGTGRGGAAGLLAEAAAERRHRGWWRKWRHRRWRSCHVDGQCRGTDGTQGAARRWAPEHDRQLPVARGGRAIEDRHGEGPGRNAWSENQRAADGQKVGSWDRRTAAGRVADRERSGERAGADHADRGDARGGVDACTYSPRAERRPVAGPDAQRIVSGAPGRQVVSLEIETLVAVAADDNVVQLPGVRGEDQLAGAGGRVGVVVGRDLVAGGVEDLEVRVEPRLAPRDHDNVDQPRSGSP